MTFASFPSASTTTPAVTPSTTAIPTTNGIPVGFNTPFHSYSPITPALSGFGATGFPFGGYTPFNAVPSFWNSFTNTTGGIPGFFPGQFNTPTNVFGFSGFNTIPGTHGLFNTTPAFTPSYFSSFQWPNSIGQNLFGQNYFGQNLFGQNSFGQYFGGFNVPQNFGLNTPSSYGFTNPFLANPFVTNSFLGNPFFGAFNNTLTNTSIPGFNSGINAGLFNGFPINSIGQNFNAQNYTGQYPVGQYPVGQYPVGQYQPFVNSFVPQNSFGFVSQNSFGVSPFGVVPFNSAVPFSGVPFNTVPGASYNTFTGTTPFINNFQGTIPGAWNTINPVGVVNPYLTPFNTVPGLFNGLTGYNTFAGFGGVNPINGFNVNGFNGWTPATGVFPFATSFQQQASQTAPVNTVNGYTANGDHVGIRQAA